MIKIEDKDDNVFECLEINLEFKYASLACLTILHAILTCFSI